MQGCCCTASVMQTDLPKVAAEVGGTEVVMSLHKERKLTVRWPHVGCVVLRFAPATAASACTMYQMSWPGLRPGRAQPRHGKAPSLQCAAGQERVAGSFTWADLHAEQPTAQGGVAATEAVTVGITGWELVVSIEALSIVRGRDCIAGLAARPREEGNLSGVHIIGDAVHARLGDIKA